MSCHSKLLSLSAAMLLAACATQPVPQVAATETPAEVKLARAASCVRETGTRIRLPPGACVSMAGRVISSEDIGHTGAVSLTEALYRLGAY